MKKKVRFQVDQHQELDVEANKQLLSQADSGKDGHGQQAVHAMACTMLLYLLVEEGCALTNDPQFA